VTFDGARKDGQLKEKLRGEADGILLWSLVGLCNYLEHGMQEPEVVSAATRQYRDEQSAVKTFMGDCTESVPGHSVLLSRLHSEYLRWSKMNREKSLSSKKLKKELEQSRYDVYRGMQGYAIRDISLSEESPIAEH
jgi:putative DNA primase/helicase